MGITDGAIIASAHPDDPYWKLQGQGLTHQEVRCSNKVFTLFVYLDGVGYYDEFTGYSATECQFLRASLG